jgi:ring-1,2-phenylacetyl-CoA epoxidase subunit PaaC
MSTVATEVSPRTMLLLSLADDELITGHRAAHWTGVAPTIEEDLAFSSIAQDEINHADVWYQQIVGTDRLAIDALALGREPHEYRHADICAREPGDFAATIARHWLYEQADAVRLEALVESSDGQIAAVAQRLLHEERYHQAHADSWLQRLAAGGEKRKRLVAALAVGVGDASWLFEPLPGEQALLAEKVLPVSMQTLHHRWVQRCAPPLTHLDLPIPRAAVDLSDPGGRHGVHGAEFGALWEEMTSLHRAHPGARW